VGRLEAPVFREWLSLRNGIEDPSAPSRTPPKHQPGMSICESIRRLMWGPTCQSKTQRTCAPHCFPLSDFDRESSAAGPDAPRPPALSLST